MNLLLDTHAVLWWLHDDPELSLDARAAIADPTNVVVVSAASVWEAEIKRANGKLRYTGSLASVIPEAGFVGLPISIQHSEAAGTLPPHHRDPFDRMLVAQARHEDLTVVTRDRAFEPYGVPVLAC